MSKKWSQLSISLGPLVYSTCPLVADTDEVVNKYCFVHWVWGARHNKTVFDKAAGELIGHLVEIRTGIIVYSTEMFQPAKPSARSQVVVGLSGASMEKQKFGLLSYDWLPPEASIIRRIFQVCDVDRPQRYVVFIVRTPSWQLESRILTCAACLLDFHLPCNQQLETTLGSRCAAEACLRRICRPKKPMPRYHLACKTRIILLVCRFIFSESS